MGRLSLAFALLAVTGCVRLMGSRAVDSDARHDGAVTAPDGPRDGRAPDASRDGGRREDGLQKYVVTTIAGSGVAGFSNGSALLAQFNEPSGIVADNAGSVLIVDKANYCVRALDLAAKQVRTFAGKCGVTGSADGTVAAATFGSAHGIAIDQSGRVYVADSGNQKIRVIHQDTVSTIAGSGSAGFKDGPAFTAMFDAPYGVAVGGASALHVADRNNHRVRAISATGVTTVAGDGTTGFADGAALIARFSLPYAIAAGTSGILYVADYGNRRVRAISSGQVSTLAGTGASGFQDGPAAAAVFERPRGVAADASGRVYVVDEGNFRIRVVENGKVWTLAGTGVQGTQDGPVSSATLYEPACVAVDSHGRVFFTEKSAHKVRMIAPQ